MEQQTQIIKENEYKIFFYPEVSSTQDIARKIIHKGEEKNFVVVAERQIAGRGRGKRKWFSPSGGLYLSIAIPCSENMQKGLSFLSSWAVAKTIEEETSIIPQVKWPNDILVEKKKVAGVLLEKVNTGKNFSLAGIGVNINSQEEDFPLFLRKKVVSLKDILGREIYMELFLNTLLKNFFHNLKLLKERGFSYILGKWLEFSFPLGEPITFHFASNIIEGFYWGVGKEGELYLRTLEGKILSFEGGEIAGI